MVISKSNPPALLRVNADKFEIWPTFELSIEPLRPLIFKKVYKWHVYTHINDNMHM